MGNSVAQTQLVKASIAIESAVFVTMQWLASIKPSSGLLYTLAEELKSQVKKMGGFFQLLIQVNTKNDHTALKAMLRCYIEILVAFVEYKLVEKSAKSELKMIFSLVQFWQFVANQNAQH